MDDNRMYAGGQVARTVQLNPKCTGCMHYISQSGLSGVCEIGLRPFQCGDGSFPSMGYAPVTSTGPDMAPAPAIGGRVYADDGSYPNKTVAMPVVSLGEEQVEMVKSIEAELVKGVMYDCPLHSQSMRSMGVSSYSSQAFESTCRCEHVTDREIAKSFTRKLTNRERSRLGDAEILEFVSSVRKGKHPMDCTCKKCMDMKKNKSLSKGMTPPTVGGVAMHAPKSPSHGDKAPMKAYQEKTKHFSPQQHAQAGLHHDRMQKKFPAGHPSATDHHSAKNYHFSHAGATSVAQAKNIAGEGK